MMNTNTASLAEHNEKGITSIDSRRMGRERITRVPMSAGTLQPNPIICMTKPRPSSPTLDIHASIMNAARERYPLSSTTAITKKNTTISGKNEATVATPPQMPSRIRLCSVSGRGLMTGSIRLDCIQPVIISARSCEGRPTNQMR